MASIQLHLKKEEPGISISQKGVVTVDFDKDSATKHLDLQLNSKRILDPAKIQWQVYDEKERLDQDDYTGGSRTQLVLTKKYAGSHQQPKMYRITALYNDIPEDTIIIKVAMTPTITTAAWHNNTLKEVIARAYYYDRIRVVAEGEGLNGLEVDVQFYMASQIHPDPVYKTCLSINETGICEAAYSFFNASGIHDFKTNHFYFILSYQDKELYNSFTAHNTIMLSDYKIDSKEEQGGGLSFVTVSNEEYFTQRYEPCKYSKITLKHNEASQILFDESLQPVKKPTRTIPLTQIIGNTAKEKITLTIEGVATGECRHQEGGFQFTREKYDADGNPKEREKAHGESIIDITALRKAGITDAVFDYAEPKSTLSYTAAYPYNEQNDLLFALKLLPLFFKKGSDTVHTIELKTCRHHKTIQLAHYPDVLFTYHLQINYEQQDKRCFFAELPVQMTKGLDDGLDLIEPYLAKASVSGIPFISDLLRELMMDYLKELANTFALGYHARYNLDNGVYANTIDYGDKFEFAKIKILDFTLRLVALEAVLLYITRGKSAGLRAVKIAHKVSSAVNKQLNKNHFYITLPNVAVNAGLNFRKQKDGAVAGVFEYNIMANPYLALEYKQEHTLGSLLLKATGVTDAKENVQTGVGLVKKGRSVAGVPAQKGNPLELGDINTTLDILHDKATEKIDTVLKKIGQNAKVILTFDGRLEADYKVQINTTNGAVHFIDHKDNMAYNTAGVIRTRRGIVGKAVLESESIISSKWGYLEEYLPKVALNHKIKIEAHGSLMYQRSYQIDQQGRPYYVPEYIFSGIKGTVVLKAKALVNDNEVYDESFGTDENPIEFTLLEPQKFPLEKVYLFESEKEET